MPEAVTPEDLSDLSKATQVYTTCPHNCGPGVRCVSKPWIVNGRVVRVTSDDSEYDSDGNLRDKDSWNDARHLACAKGRSYKYRLYHTGRLKYPMKQTKARGDVTGFVRITWEEAYNEVIRKHRAIYAKYGPAAIHQGVNNSTTGDFALASQVVAPITGLGSTRGSFSDHSFHQFNYSYSMAGIPGNTSYSNSGIGSQIPAVAHGVVKHWVSFGTNSMSTNNTLSYPYLRANQKAKEANPNFKHYVIAPELSDTGVLNATDWVQIRNQTDPALIAAMIYEMIINTFDADGNVMSNPWLDVDYIDTVLYGFFDSPEYWINNTTGEIQLTDPSDATNFNHVNAVPSGKSYASWIMGSDDRLTKANYNANGGTNYTAKAFGDFPRAGACTMPVKGVNANVADLTSSAYYTKKDYMTPKSSAWAEKICGTPAATITELARFFTDESNKPFMIEWTGGLQKSENGVLTLFAIQTLKALTKHWGYSHGSTGTFYQTWASNPGYFGSAPTIEELPAIPTTSTSGIVTTTGSGNPSTPSISCKEHFNGLYMAFKDVLDSKGFKGYANPYWDGSTRYLNDDAGAKTQVLYAREDDSTTLKTFTDTDGRTYYDYVGREGDGGTGTPIYVGKRMYIGCSGTQFNQIGNTNWAAEIFTLLPLAQDNPDDPDTFCFVVAEPYMSPQARFADYVFPLASPLEVVDNTTIGTLIFKRLPLISPPGEAKDSWEAGYIGWSAQSALGGYSASRLDTTVSYNKTISSEAGLMYIGRSGQEYKSVNDIYTESIQAVCNDPSSDYYGKTVNEAIQYQIRPKTAEAEPAAPTLTHTAMKTALDTYLSGDKSAPFVTFGTNAVFSPQVRNAMNTFTTETNDNMPGNHGRMTCYAEYAVYTWENAYNIYHGWLPADQRGQKNQDYEGDPMLYPIPMYYAFEDAFNEMYGVFNTNADRKNLNAGWALIGSKPTTNDISLITDRLTVTVGSTHDRYRSHSSQAENPYLRELNHRTKGGGWASGNDWNEYCVVPEDHTAGSTADFNPMISSAIQEKKLSSASWHEFWMNDEDAAQFQIADGDLIRVSNPVGAIRVVARVTKRIVRGHGQIHQGAWYDPNPVDGVDDGACANTLMSNRPSKFDNGNSLHCAYCVVEKETSF